MMIPNVFHRRGWRGGKDRCSTKNGVKRNPEEEHDIDKNEKREAKEREEGEQ